MISQVFHTQYGREVFAGVETTDEMSRWKK